MMVMVWSMRGQWHFHAQAARVVFWGSQRPIPGSPNLDPVLTFTFEHQTVCSLHTGNMEGGHTPAFKKRRAEV